MPYTQNHNRWKDGIHLQTLQLCTMTTQIFRWQATHLQPSKNWAFYARYLLLFNPWWTKKTSSNWIIWPGVRLKNQMQPPPRPRMIVFKDNQQTCSLRSDPQLKLSEKIVSPEFRHHPTLMAFNTRLPKRAQNKLKTSWACSCRSHSSQLEFASRGGWRTLLVGFDSDTWNPNKPRRKPSDTFHEILVV